jgi:uncharacterized protein YjbJ (UPF0337 family)
MSSTTDKAKGLANEAIGKVKEAAGRAANDRRTEAEGSVQKHKGEAQQAIGKGKDAVKKAVDNA